MADPSAAASAPACYNAAGLPGLVADSIGAYEALALSLARDPQKLGAIRAALKSGRDQAPLFNTDLFARNFEAALATNAGGLTCDAPEAGRMARHFHSSALVNQYQMLELRKRRVTLFHRDMPVPDPRWARRKGSSGFDPKDAAILAGIPLADGPADVNVPHLLAP